VDKDDVILMPWTTARRRLDDPVHRAFLSIWAKAASSEKIPSALREIREALRKEHRLAPSAQDDFRIEEIVKPPLGHAKDRF
jgi:hypothetical protein